MSVKPIVAVGAVGLALFLSRRNAPDQYHDDSDSRTGINESGGERVERTAQGILDRDNGHYLGSESFATQAGFAGLGAGVGAIFGPVGAAVGTAVGFLVGGIATFDFGESQNGDKLRDAIVSTMRDMSLPTNAAAVDYVTHYLMVANGHGIAIRRDGVLGIDWSHKPLARDTRAVTPLEKLASNYWQMWARKAGAHNSGVTLLLPVERTDDSCHWYSTGGGKYCGHWSGYAGVPFTKTFKLKPGSLATAAGWHLSEGRPLDANVESHMRVLARARKIPL